MISSTSWGSPEFIITKPGVGASGRQVVKHSTKTSEGIASAVTSLNSLAEIDGSAMCQPFIPSIALGETSIICIDAGSGRLEPISAILKVPCEGSFLVQTEHGGTNLQIELTKELIKSSEKVISAIPFSGAADARLEFVQSYSGEFLIMEVEMIEPEMFWSADARGAPKLSEVVVKAARERKKGTTCL